MIRALGRRVPMASGTGVPKRYGSGQREHRTHRCKPAGRWHRYVAIGDSSTEGMDDPDGTGGYRGWADRLAEHLAAYQGSVEYANLAIRGRTTAQILAEQVPAAIDLAPDLVTVVAG